MDDSANGSLKDAMMSGNEKDIEAGVKRVDLPKATSWNSANQPVSPRDVQAWNPNGIRDSKDAWRHFFMSDKVEAHEIPANTSHRSLLIGGIVAAIIVAVVQTQACVNCDPYPGIPWLVMCELTCCYRSQIGIRALQGKQPFSIRSSLSRLPFHTC